MSIPRLQLLKNIKALILHPANWTQGRFARDIDGISVSYTALSAICWCLTGALIRVCFGISNPYTMYFLSNLLISSSKSLYDKNLVQVNDGLGHKEVLLVLDHAIAKLSTVESK